MKQRHRSAVYRRKYGRQAKFEREVRQAILTQTNGFESQLARFSTETNRAFRKVKHEISRVRDEIPRKR